MTQCTACLKPLAGGLDTFGDPNCPMCIECHLGLSDMSEETLKTLIAEVDLRITAETKRRQEIFDQLWAQAHHTSISKQDAFYWFDAGCDWQIAQEQAA